MNYVSASQFGGGGFMSTYHDSAQDKPNFGDISTTESLRSFTVSQLQKSQQESEATHSTDYLVDGQSVKQVTIVGLVLSKQFHESYMMWRVYDGTGTIDVKQYGESDERTMAYMNQFKENTLEVIFQSKYLTQSQNQSAAGNFGVGGMPGGSPQLQGGGGVMGSNVLQPHMGGGGREQDVLNYIANHQPGDGRTGMHIDSIIQGLSSMMQPAEAHNAVQSLCAGGKLYTTESDMFFRAI